MRAKHRRTVEELLSGKGTGATVDPSRVTGTPSVGSVPSNVEDDRTGMTLDSFRRAFADHLYYVQGVDSSMASPYDYYMALAYTVRDRLMRRWIKTVQSFFEAPNQKAVFYLSAEFLIGRQLGQNLLSVGCWDLAKQTLELAGLDLQEILEHEPEPGLGNGGLGRLAACFLDSLATLDIPAAAMGSAMSSESLNSASEMVGRWRSPIVGSY